jgi:hypothetical protein
MIDRTARSTAPIAARLNGRRHPLVIRALEADPAKARLGRPALLIADVTAGY